MCEIAVPSSGCPHASWNSTPPNPLPIITGMFPDGHSGAERSATASSAAPRAPLTKSVSRYISAPLESPGENEAISNAPFSEAVARATTRVCTRLSRTARHTPSATVNISTYSSLSDAEHVALTISGDVSYIAASPRRRYSIFSSTVISSSSISGAWTFVFAASSSLPADRTRTPSNNAESRFASDTSDCSVRSDV